MSMFKKMISQKSTLYGVGILGLVLAVFGKALWFNFAPSDDLFLVVQNLAVRGPTLANLKTVFTSYDPELYIPLTFVSYQIDYLIGGLNPFIFHLSNILIHAANALLVTWLLMLLTKKNKLAIFAGLVFAIHPLQTEAVVWIAGRKDLLSTLFYLLSFIFYIRSQRKISILFFLCALLSKVNVLTLPVALLLYDHCIAHRKWGKSMIVEKVPYLALSILFLIIALAGKERVVSVLSNFEMLLLACKSAVFYLWKFIAPYGLTNIYPHNGAIALSEFYPYCIGVVLLILLMIMSKRRAGWISFGIVFYLVTLLPTFGNTAKAGFIFFAVDRYMYLPVIGVLVILIHSADKLIPKSKMIAVGVLSALCVTSYAQTQTWETGETLYARAVEVYPGSVPARASLARIYRKRGEYQKAFDVLLEALKYTDHPALHMESGYIYARVGQVQDAREQFGIASKMDPTAAEPVFSLGSLEEQVGNLIQAEQHFTKAVELDPSYVIARVRLAALQLDNGLIEKATEQLRQALQWNQNSIQAHELFAAALESQGESEAAAVHRRAAEMLRSSGELYN